MLMNFLCIILAFTTRGCAIAALTQSPTHEAGRNFGWTGATRRDRVSRDRAEGRAWASGAVSRRLVRDPAGHSVRGQFRAPVFRPGIPRGERDRRAGRWIWPPTHDRRFRAALCGSGQTARPNAHLRRVQSVWCLDPQFWEGASEAMTRRSSAIETGLTKCVMKPASRVRAMSSSVP